ncbi:MAG: endonuclease V [Pseudomonadota bacterium]
MNIPLLHPWKVSLGEAIRITFREAPILLEAYSRLKIKPDLILIDGQGIAHPCSMGIAAHRGVLLVLPAIGCAKSRLIETYEEPDRDRGNAVPLRHEGGTLGMVCARERE